jgi:hypothetical protein
VNRNGIYLRQIRVAAARVTEAERERQVAVTHARLAGVPWSDIGDSLQVTRQTARERYVAVEQLAKAWKEIEGLLSDLGTGRGLRKTTAEMVDYLVAEGDLTGAQDGDLKLILTRYSEAMRGAQVSVKESERLTDKAVPLVAALFLLREKATAPSA